MTSRSISLSQVLLFCNQNSNKKNKKSRWLTTTNMLTSLWVMCGSSGFSWAQVQACCAWLSLWLRSREAKPHHTRHLKPLLECSICYFRSHFIGQNRSHNWGKNQCSRKIHTHYERFCQVTWQNAELSA